MGTKSKPEIFQGHLKKKHYFEGWYFKVVDASFKHIFAIIPAIALNKKENSSHAFIQILDGVNAKAVYLKFPKESFSYSKETFEVNIGTNYFSRGKLSLDINQNEYEIKGELEFLNTVPWPKKFLQPGVMGWFTYVPFMECYHGVVSMNHDVKGRLRVKGEDILFDNGAKGYIEKDWGKGFPSAWIWTQSNHFSNPNLSFMFSIAEIPFLGSKFVGFLSALWLNDHFYKFATYTRAKLRSLEIRADDVQISVEDKNYKLDFEVAKKGVGSGDLKAPSSGVMIGHIAESINSKIKLNLYDKKSDKVIIDDLGVNAGLEIKNPDVLKPKK